MATAFKWLIHSACHVLGYPNDVTRGGDLKSLKQVSNNDVGVKNIVLHLDHEPSETFQMPLHYPRYTKADYEKMEEWRVDLLLKQYGLPNIKGTLEEKRAFAMGTFLWPDQY